VGNFGFMTRDHGPVSDNPAFIGGVAVSCTPVINRPVESILAFCGGPSNVDGGRVLINVSGPSSSVSPSISGSSTYCIARDTGECYGGTCQGIYFNCGLTPPAESLGYNYGFYNTGAGLSGVSQIQYNSTDTADLSARMGVEMLTGTNYLNSNNNVGVTRGGECLLAHVIGVDGVEDEVISASLSPIPNTG
jgi:hypothetical protein